MHVFELSQQRLLGRFASAQRKATDAMLIETDFASHQALRPLRMDFQAMTQNINTALRVGLAQEDRGAVQRLAQVKAEVARHACSCGRMIATPSVASAVRLDIGRAVGLQARQVGKAKAPPDLGLPERVEALDEVLKAALKRWGEHRDHAQAKAPPRERQSTRRSSCWPHDRAGTRR